MDSRSKTAIARPIAQERLAFEDNRLVPLLYGEQNAHLHKIEDAYDVEITSRGNEIVISGASTAIQNARQILEGLWGKLKQGQTLEPQAVDAAIRFLNEHREKSSNGGGPHRRHDDAPAPALDRDEVAILTRKKKISPRTPQQAAYIEAMRKYRMVFGVGPAGTGKTYMAVAMAVEMMEAGKVERIILSRPAVEAGERLGFLPGELKEKMDPYMRPLYDALYDTMSGEKVQKKILSEEIEIAPLAYMRGRTLNNAFIILDEAQNSTTQQMLMFLTRMGEGSYMVITGDPSQTDLPDRNQSGLIEAIQVLKNESEMAFVQFSAQDVVRHKLVSKVIQAYEKFRKK